MIPLPMTAQHEDLLKHAAQLIQDPRNRGEAACKVCGESAPLFSVLDFAMTCNTPRMPSGLSGAPVYYHRCSNCGFLFTKFCDAFTSAQWTTQVYNPEYYGNIDPDYAIRRPTGNAMAIDALLAGQHGEWLGLDYGGGNGRTAELLRAMGYRYYCHDPFAVSDMDADCIGQFYFCSLFEVAEHAPDPIALMREIISLCSPGRLAILIGTHVNDRHTAPGECLDWWYASPRNGHVSLHSRRSLTLLAQLNGLDCLSLTEHTHLLTRGYTPREAGSFLVRGKIRTRWRRLLRRSVNTPG